MHFIVYKLYVKRKIEKKYWTLVNDLLTEVLRGMLAALVVKNPPANAEDVRDAGSIPRLGRFPEGGHGHPLQDSCLENPMNRRAWQAIAHRVAKSQTWLKQLSTRAHIKVCSWNLSKNIILIDRVTKSWAQLSDWACTEHDGQICGKQ